MYRNNHYRPANSTSKGWVAIVAILVILVAIIIGGFLIVQSKNKDNGEPAKPAEQTKAFDKTQFSLDDPASPWLVVNKQRPLNPKEYEPADLRTPNMSVESSEMRVNEQTAAALEALDAEAKQAGINLTVASAYRSYDDQVRTYQSMVNGYGQTEADRQSARPGHSEHQTGWAADLGAANDTSCRLETCFADTPEGKWLAANAYKYGFVIRYPEGKEHVTGYSYEPWHLRYVGVELAAEMHRTGVTTLEEFFGLPAAPSY